MNFRKEYIWAFEHIKSKHIKRHSISLVIRELIIKVKTTMRHHYTISDRLK